MHVNIISYHFPPTRLKKEINEHVFLVKLISFFLFPTLTRLENESGVSHCPRAKFVKIYCVKKDVDSKWSKLIGRLQEERPAKMEQNRPLNITCHFC